MLQIIGYTFLVFIATAIICLCQMLLPRSAILANLYVMFVSVMADYVCVMFVYCEWLQSAIFEP